MNADFNKNLFLQSYFLYFFLPRLLSLVLPSLQVFFRKLKKKNKPRVNAIEIFSSFLPLVDCRSNIGKSFISYTQLTPLLADTVGNVFVTILPPENKREEIKYQNTWILISASKLSELSSSDEDTTEVDQWNWCRQNDYQIVWEGQKMAKFVRTSFMDDPYA